MLGANKIACIIPARLESTRFPKKMLTYLLGKPLLQWVWDAAQSVSFFDTVLFATDSPMIATLIESFGGKYVMTSPTAASGTDRLVEIALRGEITADIWVNWQGDEPFISPTMIHELLSSANDPTVDVWTLCHKIATKESVENLNDVKVVFDYQGNALYFSRAPIPYAQDGQIEHHLEHYYKHVGLYAFRDQALRRIATLTPAPYEKIEKLEQLRFLYNGMKIRVSETGEKTIGIDTPQDLAAAEKHMQSP